MTDVLTLPLNPQERLVYGRWLINRVFERLDQMSRQSYVPNRVFFGGEIDPKQSRFEYQSNYLMIGVLANNDTVGLCLLHFLRMIIDQNYDLLWEHLKKSEFVTFDDFFYCLAHFEKHVTAFNLDTVPTVILSGPYGQEEQISRPYNNISIWNIERIKIALSHVF